VDRSSAVDPTSLIGASVVIVHYDGLNQLRACLDSILRSDADGVEVIVVDNASLDSCTEAIGGSYPSVRFVKAPQNLGTSGGWNLGAEAATRPSLIFLNDDVIVPPRWFSSLRSNLDDPSVGVASAMALFLDQPETINSAGGILDFLGFGLNRSIGQPYHGFSGQPHEKPFYAVGTAFATRKEVLERSGGFDEEMFMYADDLDWSWRLRLLGYKVLVDERVVVYHKWRGSGLTLNRMAYLLERNELRAVLKNYGAAALIWIAPALAIVKLAKGLALLLLDRSLFRSIARGWFWNLANLRKTLQERRTVQSKRQVTDRTIVQDMVMESLELRIGLGWHHHPLRAAVGEQGV